MNIDIENIADRIIHARDTCTPLERLVEANEAPTIHEAMLIQHEIVRRRVFAGDKVVGFKLGNIAKAMQNKFGVGQPDFGPLLHSYFKPENLPLYADQFIQPYAELEPAFVLKKDLGGKYVSVADVISATDYVLPAIEIIDSRIKDWKIDIFETLADGGSVGAINRAHLTSSIWQTPRAKSTLMMIWLNRVIPPQFMAILLPLLCGFVIVLPNMASHSKKAMSYFPVAVLLRLHWNRIKKSPAALADGVKSRSGMNLPANNKDFYANASAISFAV